MEQLDLISTEKNFYFNNKRNLSSKIGGTLSLLILVISIICIIEFIVINFIVNKSQSAKRITASNIDDWDNPNVTVLLKTPTRDVKTYDIYYQINDAVGIFLRGQPETLCNDTQIAEFFNNTEIDPNYSYYCIHVDKYTRWSFKMRCFHNRTGIWNNCTDKTSAFYFKFQRTKEGGSNELVDYIAAYNDNIYNTRIRSYYNFNKLQADDGLLFGESKSKYFTELVHFENATNYNWISPGEWIVTYYIEYQPVLNQVITIQSSRLSVVFANLMGVIKLTGFLFLFINKLFEPYYHRLAILKEIINEKLFLSTFSQYFNIKGLSY